MDIIVLNAPPLSGKDDISTYLCDGRPNLHHEEVKELLFEVAVRTAGISRDLWDAMCTRRYKEIPSPYLMIDGVNVSPRQWMIHCSEKVIKPLFGKSAFGKAAVEKLKQSYANDEVIVFSDGGFPEEIQELSDHAYATGGEFFLARIHRKGYDWGNDSRNWLYLDGIRGHEKDFDNKEGKLTDCAESVLEWARSISYGEENA
ncbi:methyltransferase [Cronobacter phage EspYZU08]|nr:methyltransferase [Cronobacter phage EspYZU08]